MDGGMGAASSRDMASSIVGGRSFFWWCSARWSMSIQMPGIADTSEFKARSSDALILLHSPTPKYTSDARSPSAFSAASSGVSHQMVFLFLPFDQR